MCVCVCVCVCVWRLKETWHTFKAFLFILSVKQKSIIMKVAVFHLILYRMNLDEKAIFLCYYVNDIIFDEAQ